MIQKKTVYKVISLGAFSQLLPDGVTVLSRPCITVDDKRKKWGDEYILFQKTHCDEFKNILNGQMFFGKFGFDKNKQAKIYMFEVVDPSSNIFPDYFIITVDHAIPFNRRYDLVKSNPESFSRIFSSAYNKEGVKKCQSVLILQNGDIVTIDEIRYAFSAKRETLIPA